MTDTVAIALITAAAGFLGALVGALGAVVGPWWLQRSSRAADDERRRLESRRVAIVEWTEANIATTFAAGTEKADAAVARSWKAQAEISSLVEKPVEDFIHGVNYYATAGVDDTTRLNAFGSAGRMLTAWHRGDIPVTELQPFLIRMDLGAAMEFRNEWPTQDEIRMMSRRWMREKAAAEAQWNAQDAAFGQP
ncbi:hypothetical protein GE115_00130 [Agromyces sp. CFH 90414]|uniref:Uncharacterized protein n=1 Tax=Agromyces agglutinans TaxID=2662258 RepID=A0A6I2FAM7_9MICO|nr:hypothetical protein [Agromyces agglutinans]MRG58288.1 hypothetical protein [Agromyces agglutinans]